MKEIGGYFGLEKLVSNEYHKNLIALNSGRNALLYLLKYKNIKKLYIPYYICDSVTDILKENGYEMEKYYIDSSFIPKFNKSLEENEYLYIVNYFGQLSDTTIIALKEHYKNIIMDYTHAFFQKPIKEIDTLYTCRKFFGVPDGAYLSTSTIIDDNIEIDISQNRMSHILGRYECSASEYYPDFQDNERNLKVEPIKYMSKLTHNILGAIDYENVRNIRNKNYDYLSDKLSKYNKIEIHKPDGAFSYPLYLKNGIQVRKELAKYKIYIPTLWPNVIEEMEEESIEFNYSANILPLPCDQRYNLMEMEYLVKELEKCIN